METRNGDTSVLMSTSSIQKLVSNTIFQEKEARLLGKLGGFRVGEGIYESGAAGGTKKSGRL